MKNKNPSIIILGSAKLQNHLQGGNIIANYTETYIVYHILNGTLISYIVAP